MSPDNERPRRRRYAAEPDDSTPQGGADGAEVAPDLPEPGDEGSGNRGAHAADEPAPIPAWRQRVGAEIPADSGAPREGHAAYRTNPADPTYPTASTFDEPADSRDEPAATAVGAASAVPVAVGSDPTGAVDDESPVIRPLLNRGTSSWGQYLAARGSLWISATVIAVIFAVAGYQRRWIADDGLIVLRTVRNLLAGNGPVFNAGERVEANTSTVWTYLIWFWGWITDGQLEYVVLWVALVLSVAALPLAMFATARLHGRQLDGRWGLLLPLGAMVYIAIPPARDFATSGLEVSLCLFWIAVLWLQLVNWSLRDPQRQGWAERVRIGLLALNAGLSVLVRPELALVGALALLLVLCSAMTWWRRIAVVVIAGVLPVGYQIFRMGYYAITVPNTAVAKDASGSKWGQGWKYITDLVGPINLLLPLILAVVALVVLVVTTGRRWSRPTSFGDAQRRLRSPGAVISFALVAGLAESLYWLRQGGDFMHGRVLLAPLFLLLLPVVVVPVVLPTVRRREVVLRGLAVRGLAAVALTAIWITTLIWSVNIATNPNKHGNVAITSSGIVDERRFYIHNIGIMHPVTAQDYQNFPRMRAMIAKLAAVQGQGGGLLISAGNQDEWYFLRSPDTTTISVFFLNLGMTSMNLPLDVRVVDQMGLAYPLASHTERLPDARIGHDKDLDVEWLIAQLHADKDPLPSSVNEDWVKQAKIALTCPRTEELTASYTGGWSLDLFKHNLRDSLSLTSYRIDRVPEYEAQRCGLTLPPDLQHP